MSSIRVKISYPQLWLQHGHWDYNNLTRDGHGKWGNYQFFINDTSCTECDFWVIHEGLDMAEAVTCPPENVIFVSSEEVPQIPQYPQKYLSQFPAAFTSRGDLQVPNVSRGLYMCAWQVKKTYTELSGLGFPEKKKTLSAVVSNSTQNEGHRKRFGLINKLKGHFKDQLDWYAKGENYIENKWDGLIDYQYSIAVENSLLPYYITEKLMDCFLAYTMPIYLGAPNIGEFYPEGSFIDLKNYDYLSCIDIIEEAIANQLAIKNKEAIKEARDLVLNHYQFIPLLIRFIENCPAQWGSTSVKNKLYPIKHFETVTLFQRAVSFTANQLKKF